MTCLRFVLKTEARYRVAPAGFMHAHRKHTIFRFLEPLRRDNPDLEITVDEKVPDKELTSLRSEAEAKHAHPRVVIRLPPDNSPDQALRAAAVQSRALRGVLQLGTGSPANILLEIEGTTPPRGAILRDTVAGDEFPSMPDLVKLPDAFDADNLAYSLGHLTDTVTMLGWKPERTKVDGKVATVRLAVPVGASVDDDALKWLEYQAREVMKSYPSSVKLRLHVYPVEAKEDPTDFVAALETAMSGRELYGVPLGAHLDKTLPGTFVPTVTGLGTVAPEQIDPQESPMSAAYADLYKIAGPLQSLDQAAPFRITSTGLDAIGRPTFEIVIAPLPTDDPLSLSAALTAERLADLVRDGATTVPITVTVRLRNEHDTRTLWEWSTLTKEGTSELSRGQGTLFEISEKAHVPASAQSQLEAVAAAARHLGLKAHVHSSYAGRLQLDLFPELNGPGLREADWDWLNSILHELAMEHHDNVHITVRHPEMEPIEVRGWNRLEDLEQRSDVKQAREAIEAVLEPLREAGLTAQTGYGVTGLTLRLLGTSKEGHPQFRLEPEHPAKLYWPEWYRARYEAARLIQSAEGPSAEVEIVRDAPESVSGKTVTVLGAPKDRPDWALESSPQMGKVTIGQPVKNVSDEVTSPAAHLLEEAVSAIQMVEWESGLYNAEKRTSFELSQKDNVLTLAVDTPKIMSEPERDVRWAWLVDQAARAQKVDPEIEVRVVLKNSPDDPRFRVEQEWAAGKGIATKTEPVRIELPERTAS